jgi:hypothetical protein
MIMKPRPKISTLIQNIIVLVVILTILLIYTMLCYKSNTERQGDMDVTVKLSRHHNTSVINAGYRNGSMVDLHGKQRDVFGAPVHAYRTYHSSEWEKMWLENIHVWQHGGICEALRAQSKQISVFMNGTCCARTDTAWCLVDDSVHQFWYNTIDGRIHIKKPRDIRNVSAVMRTFPDNKKIWSWFEVEDINTGEISYEYIEPLVSHLRHPLANCLFVDNDNLFLIDRSYILPKFDGSRRSFLFDAGASSWNTGSGGPSLSYFTTVWKRYGVHWDHIFAWEGSTYNSTFYKTVPSEWVSKTTYHQQLISTSPATTPFLPAIIALKTRPSDYVVFKLDIDSKSVESVITDYMIKWDKLNLIDEFVWEHHVDNYLMAPSWGDTQDMTKSIADSYSYFLILRQKGVRAHSWV